MLGGFTCCMNYEYKNRHQECIVWLGRRSSRHARHRGRNFSHHHWTIPARRYWESRSGRGYRHRSSLVLLFFFIKRECERRFLSAEDWREEMRRQPPNQANPAGASRWQSLRPVRRVAELLSLIWLERVKQTIALLSENFHF